MRRQASIAEIVAAAWELSRRHGLGNFSMRELGERVGMRAQSLYSYVASKHDLFDAMFADGYRAYIEHVRTDVPPPDADQVTVLRHSARAFFEFAVNDPVRFQLLFQRTIPDFVPSPASLELAHEAYELGLGPLRAVGFSDAGLDLATAVVTGLASQQLANDPGGDRWARLLDQATAMLLRELAPHVVEPHRTREP